MAIVKNGLIGMNNVLTICIYHILLLFIVLQSPQKFYMCSLKGNIQELISTDVQYRYKHVQAGNTAGKSGVAAKTVELVQSLRCFPIQGSVYSLFSLFEDQALKLLWGSNVVLSCSGLGPCFLVL